MNYQETLQYMFTKLPMYQRTGQAAYKANLDNTLALDQHFGNPHKRFKSIHIAGTNGKGSVSHSLASVLQAAGYKVGLYTSPHLKDFRERIKVNGLVISEEEVVDFINTHKLKFEELLPSFFEMTVAMAFNYFSRMEVDVAVIEVGLGGRLDSTNIITPLLSVITNISKDHTNLLGNNLAQIAREKAGIIKPKVPVVIGEGQLEISKIFNDKALESGSRISYAEEKYIYLNSEQSSNFQVIEYQQLETNSPVKIHCDLMGKYQIKNMRTVLCALDELRRCGFDVANDAVLSGLSTVVQRTGLLGRWQTLHEKPKVICDTGHNIAGIKEILEQIACVDYGNLHIVFGMVEDKDVDEVLQLLPKEANYYFTKASIPRALNENLLKSKAERFGLEGGSYGGVRLALDAALRNSQEKDLIYVGGSTFVVAEVV